MAYMSYHQAEAPVCPSAHRQCSLQRDAEVLKVLVLVQPCRKIARSVTAGAKLTLRVEAGHSSGDGADCGHEANVRRRLRRTVLGRVSDHCPGEGTATELLHSSGAQLGCTACCATACWLRDHLVPASCGPMQLTSVCVASSKFLFLYYEI